MGLQLVQILVAKRVVRVDLGNATAVPLALKGVLSSADVPQGLGHQWVQGCVLRDGGRKGEKNGGR